MKTNINTLVVLLAFTVSCNFAFTQQFLPNHIFDTTANVAFSLDGNGQFAASSIYNEITSKFLRGGEISNTEIENSFSKQKDINRLGLSAFSTVKVDLSNLSVFKYQKLGWSFKLGTYSAGSAEFTKDAFGLLFKGNANYVNDTVDFSRMGFNNSNFSKIGVGIFDKKWKSSAHLNFILGHGFNDIYTRDASLIQTDNNEALMLAIDGAAQNTFGSKFIKGVGVALDVDFYIPFGAAEDRFKGVMTIKAVNLGAVRYKELQSYSVDTTINYNGFNITQLSTGNNFSRKELLDTLGVELDTAARWLALPGFIQLGKEVDNLYDRKWQSFFGVKLYPNLAFRPLVYAGAHWQFKSNMALGSQLSFGGFGNLKAGFYYDYHSDNLSIGLGTEDIVGVISKKGRGSSAVIRLGWKM